MPSSCRTLLLAMVLAPMLCTPAAADVYREDFAALDPGDALHGILLEGQEGQYEGAIENGAYVLRHHGDAGMVRYHFLTALPDQPERSLRDAGVSVVVSGDFATAENRTAGAGLVYRLDPDTRTYFAFALLGDGRYGAFKRDRTRLQRIIHATSSAIRQGEPNELTMRPNRGNGVDLFINGTQVGSVASSDITGKAVGLIAIGNGRFVFDEFTVVPAGSHEAADDAPYGTDHLP
jgi:hypothetical protein